MAESIRWGIVGTGGIAAQFATAMPHAAGGDVVAVASRTAEGAETFGDKFNIPRRHASYEALAADPSVDVVYVAGPHIRHATDTIAFLEAGKHVLCEKPLAVNHAEASAMVAVARSRGLFLMEAVWSRFLPAYTTLIDILATGSIGDPHMVDAELGFSVPVMPAHRLFDRALAGGALLDLGIYPLQLCSLVLGPVEHVQGLGTIGSTGVDEQVTAIATHKNGGLGIIRAAIRTQLASTARISSSSGSISLPAFMHCPDYLIVSDKSGERRIDCPVGEHGFRFEIEEVHRCLNAGKLESSVMPLDESMALAAIMDTIRRQIGLSYPGES